MPFQISCKEINSQPAWTISALSDLELNLSIMALSGADTSAKAKHFLPPDLDYYLDRHQIPQTNRSLDHKYVHFYYYTRIHTVYAFKLTDEICLTLRKVFEKI